jgi:hypothetical protein
MLMTVHRPGRDPLCVFRDLISHVMLAARFSIAITTLSRGLGGRYGAKRIAKKTFPRGCVSVTGVIVYFMPIRCNHEGCEDHHEGTKADLDVHSTQIHSLAMRKSIPAAALAFAFWLAVPVAAQEGAQPGDPMRIAILVDNSQTPLEPLPQIRRGLQQFVNALPPNHELMLVTTGGQMNVRVQPTRDYLRSREAIGEINFMRSTAMR